MADHRATIAELLAAAGEETDLRLEPGTYEEKVFAEKRRLTLTGAPDGTTRLLWHEGALEMQEDGFKRGTFRSYTAFFSGEQLCLRNLTIVNDAGEGRDVGQAVAAYLDSDLVLAENCTFDSRQDTLFLAPLPDEEREPRGFMGPREFAERRLTRQYFRHCRILGNIDFIFGGADAVFDDCEIICTDRGGEEPCGWVTAPCGKREDLGFVFRRCRFTAQQGAGTVWFGRPWRPEGRTVLLNCTYDLPTLSPLGFSGWGAADRDEPEAFFAEYAPVGPDGTPITPRGRNSWVKLLDDTQAREIDRRAEEMIRRIVPSAAPCKPE